MSSYDFDLFLKLKKTLIVQSFPTRYGICQMIGSSSANASKNGLLPAKTLGVVQKCSSGSQIRSGIKRKNTEAYALHNTVKLP